MNKTLLITFGCSWVYGVGVNRKESMDESQYKKHAWGESICNEYSFRGLISKNLKSNNIKFLWYDLFNHHNYKKSFEIFVGKSPLIIDNFLHYDKNPRDLLSLILENNKLFVKDFSYHRSDWVSDNKKIHTGVKKKLLNVFTYHPTKFGHQEIAKILQPEIERLL